MAARSFSGPYNLPYFNRNTEKIIYALNQSYRPVTPPKPVLVELVQKAVAGLEAYRRDQRHLLDAYFGIVEHPAPTYKLRRRLYRQLVCSMGSLHHLHNFCQDGGFEMIP